MDIPAGAIPVDQFEAARPAMTDTNAPPTGAIPVDEFESQESKYGSTGQGIQATLEGALRGAISSPGAAAVEKGLGLASSEGILGRQEQHPIKAGLGEAATLLGGTLAGTGEAALLGKAGEAAADVVGLGNIAKDSSYGAKVGSAIVKNAAEMAAYQSQDEVGKYILGDPNAGAQSAIANIGLAAALGGAGGAFFTGAVSPLWEATAGPKIESLLGAIKSRVNGEGILRLPDEITNDFKTLGVEPTPFQRADVSDHATAKSYIKDLTRAENETALSEKADLQSKVADSVMAPLGTNLEEMKVYDNNEAGHVLKDQIIGDIKKRFQPILESLDRRDAEAKLLTVADDDRLKLRDKILERGFEKHSANSKYMKEYLDAGEQLLDHETIHDFDKMSTELYHASKNFAQDANISNAQRDIRSMIADFKNNMIKKAALENERAGIEGAQPAGKQLIKERQFTNKQYAQAEALRDELGEHFGIKRPENFRQFIKAVENDVTPEQIVKKFSIKDNMDGARFLSEHFPEVFQEVIKNERKTLLKPAITAAAKKGELPIDINKLNTIITNAKGGKNQYLNTVLPPEFIQRAEAASRILNATAKAKDSGTPAGLWGVLRGVGTSALATVGWMTGHGPMQSMLMGELAARAGKSIPEAYKLAFLKFLASDKPINAKGFQAAAEYFNAAQKGAKVLEKASENVFKPGFKVLATSQMPTSVEIMKLDKIVADNDAKSTNKEMAATSGHIDHYMPEHQTALTQASLGSLQYLRSLKPQPQQNSPLDKPIAPTPAQEARYHRALEIAQQPAVVLQHIKEGTLQVSDLVDLKSMYPVLYQGFAQKLTNELMTRKAEDEPIPYKTRIGISLFLGQPMDSSMIPTSIQAAQPLPKPLPPQPGQQQEPKFKKSTNSLSKMPKSYRTPAQTSEADRADRD